MGLYTKFIISVTEHSRIGAEALLKKYVEQLSKQVTCTMNLATETAAQGNKYFYLVSSIIRGSSIGMSGDLYYILGVIKI